MLKPKLFCCRADWDNWQMNKSREEDEVIDDDTTTEIEETTSNIDTFQVRERL